MAEIDYTKTRTLDSGQQKREEAQIKEFEAAIARVKNAYYLYFIGTNGKPPFQERNQLDNMVREIQRNMPKRTAQRFKMQQLLIRYQHMAEHWDKSLRGLEAGERMPWVPISRRGTEEKAGAASKKEAAAASNNGAQRSAYLAALRDPSSQESDVRKIYNSYMAARAKKGEEGGPSFEKFQQVVAKQTSAILQKGAKAVQYRVEITDEKVALKAKAVKDED